MLRNTLITDADLCVECVAHEWTVRVEDRATEHHIWIRRLNRIWQLQMCPQS